MFKETKEGQTHSFNDGCGEKTHNDVYPCPFCNVLMTKDEKNSSENHSTWFCKNHPDVQLSIG